MNSTKIPVALTIAGSDSGGGAGIQADLRSFQAMGVFGTSAITAITAQNTLGVQAVILVAPNDVEHQIRSVLEDLPVAAIKLGMLANSSIAQRVGEVLQRYPNLPVVCDPVLIATTGAALGDSDVVPIYRTALAKRSTLITPNVPEAEALIDAQIQTRDHMLSAARRLLEMGPAAVLLKGGHLEGSDVHDLLLEAGKTPLWFSAPKLPYRGHGTGCTLASLITAQLAKGQPTAEAVTIAISYMRQHFGSTPPIGNGQLSIVLPKPPF